jgi:transmembrane sensor
MTLAMTERPQETPAEAATRWLVLLQSDDATAEEQREFAEWLAADPRHVIAYQDAQRFWAGLDGLPEQDVRAFDALLSSSAAPADEGDSAPRRRAGRLAAWRRTALLAAAAVVAALCLVGIAETWHLGADYRTATGEQRTVTLSDGSIIHLNTATALSAEFTSDARRLVLHEGEAFFSVAPDPQRPFEVVAGAGTIRALGTAFNVRSDGARVIVTVTEHVVRVSGPTGPAADVAEGHRFTYGAGGELGPVEAVDPERLLAWRRRRLLFENQPLAEVVAELNRYRAGWIVLRDPSLARLPVTAVFDVNKTGQALKTIEETLPVHTLALTDRLVLLSRKHGTPRLR